MKTRTIVILVLVVLAAILVIQNSGPAQLWLFFWSISSSLFILVILIFFMGFAIGYLSGRWGRKTKTPPPAPVMPPAQPAKKS
jgi:uncharacterized integral membrane protein